jgi:hypothetical protein
MDRGGYIYIAWFATEVVMNQLQSDTLLTTKEEIGESQWKCICQVRLIKRSASYQNMRY